MQISPYFDFLDKKNKIRPEIPRFYLDELIFLLTLFK